jgi:hypothetical protein
MSGSRTGASVVLSWLSPVFVKKRFCEDARDFARVPPGIRYTAVPILTDGTSIG